VHYHTLVYVCTCIGKVAWLRDYRKTIVGMYVLENEGLRKIPFVSMASESLNHMVNRLHVGERKQHIVSPPPDTPDRALFQ
jgi:hypothetical protein